MRTLHDIHGGIHPPERKELSQPGKLSDAPIPSQLILPLRQHLGVPAEPCVTRATPCWAVSKSLKLRAP